MLQAIYTKISIPVCVSLVVLFISTFVIPVDASKVRIKDICQFQNMEETDLIGYGLIIGLDGTGDGKGTQFTIQSLTNMMERMGLTVDTKKVKVKNVAAVLVTAKLSSFNRNGTYVDVTVSSVGDATSLQGGTLLMTPLADITGEVHAVAQGPISIGGFNVQVDDGSKIINNYTLVGRVPNGGKVTKQIIGPEKQKKDFFLSLRDPDFTTANRIAERINIKYGMTAFALDGGTVQVMIPDSLSHIVYRTRFISDIGLLTVVPDNTARVVINEKTGTIVAGQHVTIEPVAIAHGTITINIESTPVISQPEPFSSGETIVTKDSRISITDGPARVIHLKRSVYLSDVAKALNKIGAAPRDIIAIFQALKQAVALRAELIIL